MQHVPERSAAELKAFSRLILNHENRVELIDLVRESTGTNAAYEMILDKTGDTAVARAGRWLKVLLIKYPKESEEIIETSSV